jgi:hypothetical protein
MLVFVSVGVEVKVKVFVRVAVEVMLAVDVEVIVRVGVKVDVGATVGVRVAVSVEVRVGVLVGPVELVPGMTIRSISLGWRVKVKVDPVAWATPAIPAMALGAGFTVPLIEILGASCGAPEELVPEGSITQACPLAAGVNPETVTVTAMLAVGWLLTMKRVRLPEASLAA